MINKIIAVDFDGTVVNDKYPEIGKAKNLRFRNIETITKRRISPYLMDLS